MRESTTYQMILEEGRVEGAVAEAKKVLRLQGDAAFGPPDARTAGAIERLNDLGRLEELLQRVRTATSWAEVIGQPPTGEAAADHCLEAPMGRGRETGTAAPPAGRTRGRRP